MSKVFTITEGLENMGALRTGGQGSVYKGRRLGPIYTAIKLLPTPIADESAEDKNYRNFINEVAKLKKVNEIPNPNVVKILGSGITESGSLPYIEMEFIEGPDLGELLAPPHQKIFTIKESIKVAEQLAGALAHCHKVGVKHGDIKSNNVKLNINSGNYVLLDFGLSIMSDEQRRTSMRNAGAIEFMAPEQNRGEMLFQTDIYSYGVVLYELLAGQVPFPLQDSGETARHAVMVSHLEDNPPSVSTLRKQNLPEKWAERETVVPAWLLNVINRCLEKEPEKRFGNAMDLQEYILQNGLTGDPADDMATALKIENHTLQTQIAQYREATEISRRSTIAVPKPLLRTAIGIGVLLLGLSVYGLFKPSVVYYPVSKTPYVPFMLNSYHPQKALPVVKTDSAMHKSKVYRRPVKPKRRRFLGIF